MDASVRAPELPRLDFRTLFELEASYVMRSLRRLGVAPADLEDMAHEVFLAVHGQLDKFDTARPLRPWLFAFVFRIASHYRRRDRREPKSGEEIDFADDRDLADVTLEKDEKKQLVLDALGAIELERRAVFILHELDGTTCQEIAKTLGIPIGTVYSRLRLARDDFSSAARRLQAQRGLV